MIKGLAITPPILGRISIGKVVEKNGKRLPEKDDQFTITTQLQSRDGWITHPYDADLRHGSNSNKLRSIPIRMLFNDPALNLRSEFSLFDRQSGRPLCVGNGERCRRYAGAEIQSLPCPSPDDCEFAGGLCKPYGRLNVKIGDEDDLGTFIFRTTGYNSIRNLTARLHYYQAVSGNRLACLPLQLQLRGKCTTLSRRAPIYYVDITVRDGMSLTDATAQAREEWQRRVTNGFDQDALDVAAAQGFANGTFEITADEMVDIADEFLLGQARTDDLDKDRTDTERGNAKPSLADKLQSKMERMTPPPSTVQSDTCASKAV